MHVRVAADLGRALTNELAIELTDIDSIRIR
jgi:hypothetical protein